MTSKITKQPDALDDEARKLEEQLSMLKTTIAQEKEKREKLADRPVWRSAAKAMKNMPPPTTTSKSPTPEDTVAAVATTPSSRSSPSPQPPLSARLSARAREQGRLAPMGAPVNPNPSGLSMAALSEHNTRQARAGSSSPPPPSFTPQPQSQPQPQPPQQPAHWSGTISLNLGGGAPGGSSSAKLPPRAPHAVQFAETMNKFEELSGGEEDGMGVGTGTSGGGGGLLWGSYDEKENHASFLDALKEWRGESAPRPRSSGGRTTPRQSSGTGTEPPRPSTAQMSEAQTGADEMSYLQKRELFLKNLRLASQRTYFDSLVATRRAQEQVAQIAQR